MFIFRCVFIMNESAPTFSLDNPLYLNQLKKDLALNVYKNNVWGSYRHLLLEPPSSVESVHSCANTTIRGDLSSFKWLVGPLVPYSQKPDDSKIVHNYYCAVNFKDIMLATGKLAPDVVIRGRINQENLLGFEYSGRNEKGERLMGLIASKGLSNLIQSDPYFLWKIPDQWSLEDAATIPVVYGTV